MGDLNVHLWQVNTCIRTRNLSYRGKFWSRETKFSSSKQGFRVIRVRVNQVKMTEKLGQILEGIETHFELVGEFELSEFELLGFYCIFFYTILTMIIFLAFTAS